MVSQCQILQEKDQADYVVCTKDTKTWPPLDPPYLIDLIDLIRSACPLLAIVPITFGKSPDMSELHIRKNGFSN